jgi:hypothetical protein
LLEKQLERMTAAGIQMISVEDPRHFMLERDGFLLLVQRKETGFGNIGAAGLVTEKGLAVLTWQDGEGFFVAKGLRQKASSGQVEALRRFEHDVHLAIEAA